MPPAAEPAPLARQHPLHDYGEERAQRSAPFVPFEDGVIVLDERELRGRGKVLRIFSAQSCTPANSGNDALNEREIRSEQLLRSHMGDPATGYRKNFYRRGKTSRAVAPLRQTEKRR